MLDLVNKLLANIAIFVIKIYQKTLSPDKGIPSLWLKGRVCAHTPHCSQYGINALKRYGFFPGIFYTTQRVMSCKPSYEKIYDPEFYKIVFFSGSDISLPFLEQLNNDKRFEITAVVTAPDKPIGRGMTLTPNVVKQKAIELGIPVQTPEKLNPDKSDEGKQFYDWLKYEQQPDFLVVIAYGRILPMKLLDIPKFGSVNTHLSILPKYRGTSPVQYALLDGIPETGITVMLMDEEMDHGDMMKIAKFDIKFNDTAENVLHNIQTIGPKVLADSLWDYAKGDLKPIAQDHGSATYCSKITKEDGKIEIFNESLDTIFRKYKAFHIWPKIWFETDDHFKKTGLRIVITDIQIDENLWEQNKSQGLFDSNLKINSAVKSMTLKPEGKNTMPYQDFIRGYGKTIPNSFA